MLTVPYDTLQHDSHNVASLCVGHDNHYTLYGRASISLSRRWSHVVVGLEVCSRWRERRKVLGVGGEWDNDGVPYISGS